MRLYWSTQSVGIKQPRVSDPGCNWLDPDPTLDPTLQKNRILTLDLILKRSKLFFKGKMKKEFSYFFPGRKKIYATNFTRILVPNGQVGSEKKNQIIRIRRKCPDPKLWNKHQDPNSKETKKGKINKPQYPWWFRVPSSPRQTLRAYCLNKSYVFIRVWPDIYYLMLLSNGYHSLYHCILFKYGNRLMLGRSGPLGRPDPTWRGGGSRKRASPSERPASLSSSTVLSWADGHFDEG